MTAQQLKNSILQMAVQGKLVPQDPDDEPASVLLERIRAEKEKLIKEGKIKKEKNPSVIFRGSDNLPYEKIGKEVRCIADEIPFEIPDSWEWVRLGNVGSTNIGLTYSPSDKCLTEGIVVLRSNNIKNGLMDYNDCLRVSCQVPERALINKGDILICARNGSRSLVGKAAIVDQEGMAFGAFMAKYSSPFNPYVHLFIESPVFRNQLDGVNTETINQITQEMLKNQLIPLPPLAEQKRIVEKIEELLPHIEEYGKTESKVSKLNAEFPEQLKKSILQWAIQGKLVQQNPNDEPASFLLERIRAEKAKLIKEGKIKKDKNESVIFRRDNSHYTLQGKNEVCIDDKIPFDLPDGWAWCNLQMVTTNIHYGYTASAAPTGNSKLLRITDIQNNAVNWEDVPFCTVTPNELEGYQLHNRDIMIARTGGTIGKTYIVRNLNETAVFASYLIRAIPVPHINEEYLKIFMESPFYWKQLKDFSSGTGQPNVNGNSLKNLLLPLPPLEEQERIVQFYFEFLPTVISLTEFSL